MIWASIVFPVPGFPMKSTPLIVRAPIAENALRFCNDTSINSRARVTTVARPPKSSNLGCVPSGGAQRNLSIYIVIHSKEVDVLDWGLGKELE